MIKHYINYLEHLGPSHDIIKVLKVSRSIHFLISVGKRFHKWEP